MGAGTLLLVDDDAALAELLGAFLAQRGYLMRWADRPSAAGAWLGQGVELVLLDVMLPEQEGFEVLEGWRAQGLQLPVLMLTARGAPGERVRGLRAGADDYLPKPFDPEELVARIEALLRRARLPAPSEPPLGTPRLDPDRSAWVGAGRVVPLTAQEYRLLGELMAHPGRVRSRDQLLEALDEAGAPKEVFDRAIDVAISRLRGKLEPERGQPRHLITVRGQGYRYDP